MKILCISDYVDPMIYNQNVKQVFPDIDAILCAGDLPTDYIDFIVSVFNKPTYFVFGNHNLKDFGYYHRINSPQGEQQFLKRKEFASSGAKYLGFKTHREYDFLTKNKEGKYSPLLIAGVSGSNKYNNGPSQYTNNQMKLKLIKMIPKLISNKLKYGRYLDIFLTHATPRHIHDHEDPCHKGFECFNWFIEKFMPTYMVHGHIHLYDLREERVSVHKNTTIINAYAHYILEIPNFNCK